jgi:uncharacterized protein with von Willebrand factor type A (vWA) domain
MSGRVDFSADLILICNSLDAGGFERVVSTLANERSRRVCAVTMHDRRRFFELEPAVHHVIIDRVGLTWLPEALKRLKSRLRGFTLPKPLLLALFGEAARERVSEYDLPRALAARESAIGLKA